MPVLRPELTPDIPAVDVPLVDTSGRLNDEWRRFLELLLLKTGRGYDQPFISAVQAEENLAAIQELTERLDVLESRATEDPIPADQIEDLRAQIADLRAAVTNADQSDLEDLRAEVQRLISVADDGAAGVQGAREEAQTLVEQLRSAIDEVSLIRSSGGVLSEFDAVDNALVAASANIRLSKLYYPQKTQASSASPNWNSGAGVIRLTRGSTNTSHVIFEKTFTDVSATNLVFFNGSVLVTPSEQSPGTVDDATTTTVTSGKWLLKESSSSGTGGTVLAQGNINYSTQPGGWQSNNTATDSFQEALNKVYTLSNTGTVYVKLIYQFTSGNLADIADFGSNTAFQVTGALGIDD
jgi:hypothetical protein